jgi:formylglycine-generating enzyme required for sulfatase activity
MNQSNINIPVNKAISLQMVEIPQGEITLRDDRIKNTWTVRIESFLMAKYAVTLDLYFEITQQSPSTSKGNQKPVETVSWKEAVWQQIVEEAILSHLKLMT